MSLEVYTPIDNVPRAKEAVVKLKGQYRRKKGLTPLEVQRRRDRIIEAFDIASGSAKNKQVSKIYRNAKRDLEEEEYG